MTEPTVFNVTAHAGGWPHAVLFGTTISALDYCPGCNEVVAAVLVGGALPLAYACRCCGAEWAKRRPRNRFTRLHPAVAATAGTWCIAPAPTSAARAA